MILIQNHQAIATINSKAYTCTIKKGGFRPAKSTPVYIKNILSTVEMPILQLLKEATSLTDDEKFVKIQAVVKQFEQLTQLTQLTQHKENSMTVKPTTPLKPAIVKGAMKAPTPTQGSAPAPAPVSPVLKPIDLAAPAKVVVKTMNEGKVSTALKRAFTDENNAIAAYEMLGKRFNWSVKPVIESLLAEHLWPLTPKGKPQGYKNVYKDEKAMEITSYGHFVNRCSERFSMLNPENIAKRDQAKADAEEKKKEKAAEAAKALVEQVKKPGKLVGSGFDLTQLKGDEVLDLAKLCIMALTEDQADILAADKEIKAKFQYDGE